MTIPLICLMGPTASGKTALAVELAKIKNMEIISVDSALVYRGMDIGTAKPTAHEKQGITHHLIDIREPFEPYSAAQFVADVKTLIPDILSRGRTPLCIGGTMLYFKAMQEGLSPLPEANPELRKTLLEEAQRIGWQAMHTRLTEYDPIAAALIKPNDKQRIQRALEVCLLSDKPMSWHWQQAKKQALPYDFINLALVTNDRATLHQRIETRFDSMLEAGFIEEVKALMQQKLSPDTPAMRSVAYRQAYAYLNGEYDANQMREKAIVATRQLAKRQLTWLRSWPNLQTFDMQADNLVTEVLNFLPGKG